jgi:hypothetical protein
MKLIVPPLLFAALSCHAFAITSVIRSYDPPDSIKPGQCVIVSNHIDPVWGIARDSYSSFFGVRECSADVAKQSKEAQMTFCNGRKVTQNVGKPITAIYFNGGTDSTCVVESTVSQ